MHSGRIPNEAQTDHLDSLISAYAAVAGYVNRVEGLEIAITSAYAEAINADPVFGCTHSILGPYAKEPELRLSKAAWIGQHLFRSRGLCIGNWICMRREGTFQSPLVDQMAEVGLLPRTVPYDHFHEYAARKNYKKRIDAIFWNASEQTIFPIKAVPIQVSGNVSTRTLFDEIILKTEFTCGEDVAVPSASLASLVLSQNIFSTAFPRVRVRPMLMMLHPNSWDFQIHETTDLALQELCEETHRIHRFPFWSSSRRLLRQGMDLSEFEKLPNLPAKSTLSLLPVDRATRCYMILDLMLEHQLQSDRLVMMSAAEIADKVQRRHLIAYPVDLRRHDIEDCLEPSFLERPRYDGTGYALTATGAARALIMRRQLQPSAKMKWEGDGEAEILAPIRRQARLWAQYKSGRSHIS